jgi:hypothetical protein
MPVKVVDGTAVRRPSQILDPLKMPLKWILENHQKFYTDRKLIQRLLDEWELYRRNEYLFDVLTGASCKDLIILAEIKPILQTIVDAIEELKGENDDSKITKSRIMALEENREYFQDLLDKGYEFLIIDGQHRIHEIVNFFQFKKTTEPFVSPKSPEPIHDFGYEIDDEFIPYNINHKTFKEIPEKIRDLMLIDIDFLIVFIGSGEIKSLKGLFKRSNDNTPIGFFQDLISSSYGPVFRWVTDYHDEETQTRNVMALDKKFVGFTKNYNEKNKGLAFANSELLLYVLGEYGVKKELRPKGKKTDTGLWSIFEDDFHLPNKEKELTTSNINIIADGIKTKESLNPLTRASYSNAFIFLCAMRDKNHPQRKGYDIPVFKVKQAKELMEWFFPKETKRLEKDLWIMDGDTPKMHIKLDGTKEKIKNPNCYEQMNRRIWDYNYIEVRLNMMWEDFVSDYQDLELKGIIVREGEKVTNQPKTRIKVAAANDWKDAYGKSVDVYNDLLGTGDSKYDVGHLVHNDDGGSVEIENLQLEASISNRKQQNR